MQDYDVQPSELTRRRVLGGMGIAGLALMSSPALAQETVDLHVPGGPSTRMITTSYPQKGRMILQRSSPPWLETPFEVFDKGVFTPNDQHYVSWHWANFPGDIDVDSFRLTVRGQVNQALSLSLKDILQGLPRFDIAAVNQCAGAREMHVEHLDSCELVEHSSRCEARRQRLEPCAQRDVQAVGQEGDEDVRL